MGIYIRLVDFNSQKEKEKAFLAAIKDKNCSYAFECKTEDFNKIPGNPIAYWVSENMRKAYTEGIPLEKYSSPRQGMATSDNDRFLKFWHEVNICKIGFNFENRDIAKKSQLKWFPYNKGGSYKKWFGNAEYVVNWENDGFEIKNFRDYKNSTLSSNMGVAGLPFIFKESISWSKVCAGKFSVRYLNCGFLFDVSGCSIYANRKILKKLIAFLNSSVVEKLLEVISQTINFEVGSIKMLPIVGIDDINEDWVDENILLTRTDWDSFETSWDFETSPLIAFNKKEEPTFNIITIGKNENGAVEKDKRIMGGNSLQTAYENYKNFTENQFLKLKANEEELNRLFIEIYSLQDELTPDIAEKDVTVARIFDKKEDIPETMKGNKYALTREDVVKDFISYAVGCIFGRYSPYKEGLIFAGGTFDYDSYATLALRDEKYDTGEQWQATFIPVHYNVIPITDKEYFDNDIVKLFCSFVEFVYGKASLEQNLNFIAQSLNVKGATSRDMIRNYFVNDFYADHVKKYKKRPIYWQLDSGKSNGFKALFYLHRYDESTLPIARVDYLHELQFKYNFEMERLKKEKEKQSLSTAEKVAADKLINNLSAKLDETKLYDQILSHACNLKISLDLDDGVKVNYTKLQELDGTTELNLLTAIKL